VPELRRQFADLKRRLSHLEEMLPSRER
jgi:hypothetical protein